MCEGDDHVNLVRPGWVSHPNPRKHFSDGPSPLQYSATYSLDNSSATSLISLYLKVSGQDAGRRISVNALRNVILAIAYEL